MHNNKLSPEKLLLIFATASFLIFLWLVLFLLWSMRPQTLARLAAFSGITAGTPSPGFVLPPTWTPTPARQINPTPTGTIAAAGIIPTRIYTPRPTSLPGIPMPAIPGRVSSQAVLDLARIMQGESPGDLEAAYRVGWVAKNRLLHQGYGDTFAVVSHGFFGYRADLQPSPVFLDLARRVIKSNTDPTGGCLYALSRTDITKLGIHPGRADVTYGEWFFFKTWPLSAR